MTAIAQLRWMGIGFPSQQSLWIRAGAVGLVAELDAAKVAFCPLLALFGSTESLARARGLISEPSYRRSCGMPHHASTTARLLIC